MGFVNKDVNEKGFRMILNFGHTFAHAIEIKNNYSKNTTHGEAVLSGMILATKLSVVKRICSSKILNRIKNLYLKNGLAYTYKKYKKLNSIKNLIPNIGKTALPNKNKISINNFKKLISVITQY